jgi:hypothetical protein
MSMTWAGNPQLHANQTPAAITHAKGFTVPSFSFCKIGRKRLPVRNSRLHRD